MLNIYEVSKKDVRNIAHIKNSKKDGYQADNGIRLRKMHNLTRVPLCEFFSGTDPCKNVENVKCKSFRFYFLWLSNGKLSNFLESINSHIRTLVFLIF